MSLSFVKYIWSTAGGWCCNSSTCNWHFFIFGQSIKYVFQRHIYQDTSCAVVLPSVVWYYIYLFAKKKKIGCADDIVQYTWVSFHKPFTIMAFLCVLFIIPDVVYLRLNMPHFIYSNKVMCPLRLCCFN